MMLNIKYITTKDHKHLLWTVDEDDGSKMSKITVCDCFLEWGIAFLRKYTGVNLSYDFMEVFKNTIPNCDVYSVFGPNCIVVCRNAFLR